MLVDLGLEDLGALLLGVPGRKTRCWESTSSREAGQAGGAFARPAGDVALQVEKRGLGRQ